MELLTHTPAASLTGIGQLGLQVEMLFWFMMKTYFFIFLAMWVRATLPRLKPDQLMGFSWKFLIPLSLINIFVIAIEKFMMLPGGQSALDNLPLLKTGPVLSNWAIWVVIATVVFGGFFVLMSRLLSQKLEARLARR